MKRPWVKVCGITRREDAEAAVAAGARALGFILVPESPRAISVEDAAAIAADLPPTVARVGVVQDASLAAVTEFVEGIGLTAIQAHGNESADLCRAYPRPVVRAIRTAPGCSVEDLEPWNAWPILLDGYHADRAGGTGLVSDWTLARAAVDAGFRILLAGGLGPMNIVEAVRQVHPVAVDLNSAVESAPGVKNAERIRQTVAALPGEPRTEGEDWPW